MWKRNKIDVCVQEISEIRVKDTEKEYSFNRYICTRVSISLLQKVHSGVSDILTLCNFSFVYRILWFILNWTDLSFV